MDRRAEHPDEPGVHALIVGVSDYPHLSKGNDKALGMRPLSSTALTAYKIYEWLTSHHEQLPLPLLTCRLLLSPVTSELDATPGLKQLVEEGKVERAEIDNVRKAAFLWREEARRHSEGITFFYFSGHGLQRSQKESVMLLEGFGEPWSPLLHHAIDVNNLFEGMAPTRKPADIALTQLYFIDACRNLPEPLKEFDIKGATAVFDVLLNGPDSRRAPIFYAALADSKAYALKGDQTVFSKAFLHCIALAAEDPMEDEQGEQRWPVTVLSLNSALASHFERLPLSKKGDQDFMLDGNLKDATIFFLREPPPAYIVIELDPVDAVDVAHIQVMDAMGNVAHEIPAPLPNNPHRVEVPAGLYGLTATIDPPHARYKNFFRLRPVTPPRTVVKVKVGS